MCEATVFLTSDGRETKIMENVITLRPEDGHLLVTDLLGRQRLLRARVKDVDFLRHRITLEEVSAQS